MRVIIDCNILVSFLTSPGSSLQKIQEAWKKDIFEVLISNEILEEIEETLRVVSLQGYFDKQDYMVLLKLLIKKATMVNVTSVTHECVDPDDNRYLNCAKDGKANYLITGDKHHLLPMRKYKYTKIISPSDFTLILAAYPKKIKN